jgi:hypothetical protein
MPPADFIEVITTEKRPPKGQGKTVSTQGGFLLHAGYARMESPLKSAPLRLLNLETGFLDSVSARKYYYYVDIRK